MPPNEVAALGGLAAALAGEVTARVEELHQAVGRRVFASVGPAGAPVRAVHDAISDAVYAALRTGAGTGGRLVEGALAPAAGVAGGRQLSRGTLGNGVIGAVDALVGDRLAREGSDLAISMAVRHDHRDVNLVAGEVGVAFPRATPRLAVFVPGLGETEDAWKLHAGDPPATYGSRLAADLGYTPVYLRYNTGLHISENGRLLASLLADLVVAWPTPVEGIVLVGHSMGGLVARSACHHAGPPIGGGTGTGTGGPPGTGRRAWVDLVTHVVCLGSPHRGAPLEQAVSVLSWLLAGVPEARPVAGILNVRSSGIKDLRFGYLVDDDWAGVEAMGPLSDNHHPVPLLAGARHAVVAATVTADPDHPVGRVLGDLLVRAVSARGEGADHTHHVGAAHHLALLNHPGVYEQLRDWLGAGPRDALAPR
jgi:hypothetical protein